MTRAALDDREGERGGVARCTCAESNATGATSAGYRCAACADDAGERGGA